MPFLRISYVCSVLWVLLASSAAAQPSTSTTVAFRLYDGRGRVRPSRLAREYVILDHKDRGADGQELKLDGWLEYNKKDRMYYAPLGAIYSPFVLMICRERDTMDIVLPDSYLAFERLIFRPGHYYFPNIYPFKESKLVKEGYYVPVYTQLRDVDWESAAKRYDSLWRRK